MKLPREVAVMTLPNATLFPQALLPLHIFEPRYRRMLAAALAGDRMFAVAMQKPGSTREKPMAIAGLGLIRAAVQHTDGSSHLILQGLTRVELDAAVRYRPYRVHAIRTLASPPCNDAAVGALVTQVRDLLAQRFQLGLPFPFPVFSQNDSSLAKTPPPSLPAKEILHYLDNLATPDQVADLVSCAVLSVADERQTILETINVETRLNHLVRFLLADLSRQNKNNP
jgi:ATP-dependent Lon protease